LLRRRWPEARVVGVDSSDAMLAEARDKHPGIEFVCADITHFVPDTPAPASSFPTPRCIGFPTTPGCSRA
jgi:trans-aconitate methyltransferase